MKILKKTELGDHHLENVWPEVNLEAGFTAVEAEPRYQPEQATDELPYQTIEPFWPNYGHYDSPLAE